MNIWAELRTASPCCYWRCFCYYNFFKCYNFYSFKYYNFLSVTILTVTILSVTILRKGSLSSSVINLPKHMLVFSQ